MALIVEVADTTKRYDLGTKARIYAAAGVPEYWVVNIPGEVIHQLWSPADAAFAEQRTVAFGSTIRSATIAALTVETAGL